MHCTEHPGLPSPRRGTRGRQDKSLQYSVCKSHRVRADETAGASEKGLVGNGHCARSWPPSVLAMQLPRGHARGALRPNAPHPPLAPSILAKKKKPTKKPTPKLSKKPKTSSRKQSKHQELEKQKLQPVHHHITMSAAAPSWAWPEGGCPEPPSASLASRSML